MIILMENTSNISSTEKAQRLFDKVVELENKRRRSAQARVPSDPNTWQYIRENYEAIILEDHMFSEMHEIEYALWQLHYKRIEELRSHFSAALASAGTNASQGGKGTMRPDRVGKIRSQLKSFLSEATGFYHDLMLKIRSKYGLPLGILTDDQGNHTIIPRNGNSSAEIKKGLLSCHRCLIYLGDLARYKGLYGEGDSKSRDFVAASSYYSQASSLWPSSGNPHHQLAILASYSGDELISIYRYFRSLAAEAPFITARDNLIIAFEKNRQSYTQLLEELKNAQKKPSMRATGKYRAKGEISTPPKGNKTVSIAVKEQLHAAPEAFKVFSIRFVRLNGILFTRTSLETFEEVLSKVMDGLLELLSTSPEDQYQFGSNTAENKVVITRLVAILIFTVHNVNRETENQSYAEILQRSLLLQNAFTATFEFMDGIFQTCTRMSDPSDSVLLPGVLILLEWLASNPNITAGAELEEKLAFVKSSFWESCASLLNKLMASGFVSFSEDEDETCFFNMSTYDEGESTNRNALWEDFELRGFLPLLPAQLILDFSVKQSLGVDGGMKERSARVQRIVAAGKALGNTVKVGQSGMFFDRNTKKFLFGKRSEIHDHVPPNSLVIHNQLLDSATEFEALPPRTESSFEEEDEVIVFKPSLADTNTVDPYSSEQSVPFSSTVTFPALLPNASISNWSFEETDPMTSGFSNMSFAQNEFPAFSEVHPVEAVIPSKFDSVMSTRFGSDPFSAKPSSLSHPPSRPNPVSRPTRHFGPPPGFAPPKQKGDSLPSRTESLFLDDYSWLDGGDHHIPYAGSMYNPASTSGNVSGGIGFPFPGKQLSSQFQKVANGEGILQGANQKLNSMPEHSLWGNRFFV